MNAAILVVAKAPVAGFAKTRLSPPLTPAQAAQLAAAALLDTLSAAAQCPAARRVVALCGDLAAAERANEITAALEHFEVIEQNGSGFAERLANAHLDTAALVGKMPILQVGMDTPQADPALLAEAMSLLERSDTVLGLAADGGWWALGVRDAAAAKVLIDVPMSTDATGELTRQALLAAGNSVTPLPVLVDVDHLADVSTVARDPRCGANFAAAARRFVA
ncbi:DUF2064 domain-containing protein [Skermania sp. ID1734]|uniref:TIGR04282 family arsenosugar biosynthesis glycosyltransferase n=1 Tax=Skermania sp. ID1734 TaxID=2597516 RepID=UPI00117F43CB|nr:DUF2064 domain-containing protein [Skermania sp. ID1734]TSE02119.1 DUF2064 domain-containing protein [Skermania sp. ID1734]